MSERLKMLKKGNPIICMHFDPLIVNWCKQEIERYEGKIQTLLDLSPQIPVDVVFLIMKIMGSENMIRIQP